ncbi:hypothetical protein NL676_004725 [Syzygium grande]|nr:hypothetical protein NL676_004725 [Syzygium grande]
MASLGMSLLVLFLALAMTRADPGPKQVKCQEKNYPLCYPVKLHCLAACLSTCKVDCASCQPVGTSGSTGGDTGDETPTPPLPLVTYPSPPPPPTPLPVLPPTILISPCHHPASSNTSFTSHCLFSSSSSSLHECESP